MARTILSDADRVRIRNAVAAAEAKTSGEIFTVVAEISDDYRFIPILWATLVALIVPLPLIFFTLLPASLIFLIQLGAFVVLALAFSHRAIRPWMVPPGVLHGAARALSVQQFLAHGLHTTEQRTGVLIFVSLMERHAEIIADAGISAKVDDAVWRDAMEKLVGEIGAGRLAEGLIATIETTGIVLAKHFPRVANDRNELPNGLVLL